MFGHSRYVSNRAHCLSGQLAHPRIHGNEPFRVRFQAEYDDEWSSHLVTSINGATASNKDGTYWSFEDQYDAAFDRGVDLIGVFNTDVIVFRFKSWRVAKQGRPAHQGRPAKPV
uniref:Uncharacterized protein n=1 Tax=Branchiostoma floridae TaxID=7739 RepID=C3YWY8_BRAFL|eukprot:XP_002599370.1 hypothetical protein BRAFLDRAFT_64272 [Branchiostoma floridae]